MSFFLTPLAYCPIMDTALPQTQPPFILPRTRSLYNHNMCTISCSENKIEGRKTFAQKAQDFRSLDRRVRFGFEMRAPKVGWV